MHVHVHVHVHVHLHVHVHVLNHHQACMRVQATYSIACDTLKTAVKVPGLSTLMSPVPAATDSASGAKHAWQALGLLFLGLAAATLNRRVGAKGASVFCPQAALLLPITLLVSRLQAYFYPP